MVGWTFNFDSKSTKVATFKKKMIFSISAAIYVLVTHIIERRVMCMYKLFSMQNVHAYSEET